MSAGRADRGARVAIVTHGSEAVLAAQWSLERRARDATIPLCGLILGLALAARAITMLPPEQDRCEPIS